MLKGTYEDYLDERLNVVSYFGFRVVHEQRERERGREQSITKQAKYLQLTGGSGRPLRLRQWISLCTAPVQPLPANTTQSFSEAFSALRIINLII